MEPPLRVSAVRTSAAARFLLSVRHCTRTATPPAADRPVDVLVRDGTLLRLLDGVVQRGVAGRIAATGPGRHLHVLDQLGEQLAAPGVDDGLLVLSGGPLGVAAHDLSFTMSTKSLCMR